MSSRINLLPPIPVEDQNLDRVQKRLADAITSIIAAPALDAQLVTITLQSSATAQVVSFTHRLNRVPVGILIVACSAVITAFGAHVLARGTCSITLTTPTPISGGTVSLLVF